MANKGLHRKKNPMPDFVAAALSSHKLIQDFNARPAYQQNDYLGWINHAKRQETREKRLQQMLDELSKGGIYMKMAHPPSRK